MESMLRPEEIGIGNNGNDGNDSDYCYLRHPYYDLLAVRL